MSSHIKKFATRLVLSIRARKSRQILDWWQENAGEEIVGGDELKEEQEAFYTALESLQKACPPDARPVLWDLEFAHQACVTIAADACLMSGMEIGKKISAR